jgi:WD domain, G-beta repeat
VFPRIYSLLLVHLIGSVAVAGQLAFTPDGRSLIIADPDGMLRVHNNLPKAFDSLTFRAHKGTVLDLAVSPDGQRVLSAGADGFVRVWDRATWKEIATFEGHKGAVYSIAISPDGKIAASGGADKTARLWDPSTGVERAKLEGHVDAVVSVCFSTDGRYLYSGSTVEDAGERDLIGSRSGEPIRCWDVLTGKANEVPVLRGHTVATSARMLAIGNEVLTAPGIAKGGNSLPAELTARLVTPAGKVRATVVKCGTGVTFSPDGLYLAVTGASTGWQPNRILRPGDQTRGLVILDALDGAELLVVHGEIRGVTFSPDSRFLARWTPSGQPVGMMSLHPGFDKKTLRDPDAAWDALSGEAKEAHASLWALIDHGPKAVELIGQKLKPTVEFDEAAIKQAIAELDSVQFAKREAASKRLTEAGPIAVPALRSALANQPSAEVRQRVEALLSSIEAEASLPGPESRRRARAVAVLERIGTPDARTILEKLAAGAPATTLTEDASAAVGRLKRRPVK